MFENEHSRPVHKIVVGGRPAGLVSLLSAPRGAHESSNVAPPSNSTPAPGWVGGFAQSNPAFAYPDPDLSSLPVLGNFDNIDKLQRQQDVLWPEFSWQTIVGQEDSRAFQMFAPDISRAGYTNEGRIYSVICPQQGFVSELFGALNIEVSVTGQRGWVDETAKTMAADMSVEGKVWFSPSAHDKGMVKFLKFLLERAGLDFPLSKAKAIKVETHKMGDPSQPLFPVTSGISPRFELPDFANHPEAWDVSHLEVQVGGLVKTGEPVVDEFNQLVMDVLNLVSGNFLTEGNVLTWNVFFTAPQVVDVEEWKTHAERWRKSIDADHGSPDGEGSKPRYADGKRFFPGEQVLKEEHEKVMAFLKSHLHRL